MNISPQRLREWFCCEMALLGVNDRYIDAFCGRTPKSILARNYTDYSPEKLKQIYEKADLKVLTQSGDSEAAKLIEQGLKAGTYEVKFSGERLSSGMYFYTLKTDDFVQTKKMILIK